MRLVVQRVSSAAVAVAGERIAGIGAGLLVLAGLNSDLCVWCCGNRNMVRKEPAPWTYLASLASAMILSARWEGTSS